MTSSPRYRTAMGFAASAVLGLVLIVAFPVTAFRVVLVAIVVGNALQLPKAAWGFRAEGGRLYVWYPMWPRANLTLNIDEIASADVLGSTTMGLAFTRRAQLRLCDGRLLNLHASGTSDFDALVAFLGSIPSSHATA